MDPLSALREFTIRGEVEKIVRVGDDFHFGGEYSFPCGAPTAYRSLQGNLYSLETLLLFVQSLHLKHADYIKSANSRRIPPVTLPDRKTLLDYLSGLKPTSDSIEFLPNPDLLNLLNNHNQQQNPPNHPPNPNNPNPNPNPTLLLNPPAETTLDDAPIDASAVGLLDLIRRAERPLKDRESLLECRNRDFYALLVASTRREEERQRIESQQRKDGLVAKSRLMGADESSELGFDAGAGAAAAGAGVKPKLMTKIGEGVPIVLVPSASQTLITIHNVKEFLEDGVFIPTDVKLKQVKGPKPDCVTVQKKLSRDRGVTAYEVRDKPSALKSEDWDRVVAVFVLGKEWQFKDWPFKDHVEIFNKIIGFFMRFEDDSVESAKIVKQWNVKIISISKNKRHQDRAAALEVWDRLEEFVRSRSHS